MIAVANRPLDPLAQKGLRRYQADINAVGHYPDRVAAAKTRFSTRNTRSNAVFNKVRAALTEMCSGARRCMYCEDSVADEVEHVRPKDLYPEAVFVWENYLYSCGPCNGGKVNRYLVLVPPNNTVQDVTRRPRAPVLPPAQGDPVFLNPRQEDGMLYMQLDLAGTFRFTELAAPDTVAYERAKWTIEILKLNDRDYLVEARREAFGSYFARLREIIADVEAGESPRAIAVKRQALLRMGHPTVWAEIKRQHQRLPRLRALFERLPDALTWRVP